MINITYVKKKLEDGSWCAKCNDVSSRLEKDGILSRIDHVAVADVTQPESDGIQLAQEHSVDRAPFFIVKDSATGSVEVFDIYFKFKRHLEKNSQVAA